MAEKMLYILGVADDNIKNSDKNTQLNSIVATYVGVNESNIVASNEILSRERSNWFDLLSEDSIQLNNVDKLTPFFNEEQNLKPNTFLLKMKYNVQDEESAKFSAENINIMFFNTDGSESDKSVNIVIDDNKISSAEAELVPKSIRVLIEDVTGIVIKPSESNKLEDLDVMTNVQGQPPNNKVTLPPIKLGGSSHKTRKHVKSSSSSKKAKNNKKGGSKTKRKASLKRGNKKK